MVKRIAESIQGYSVAQWVAAITINRDQMEPFIAAAMTYWAMILADVDLDPSNPPAVKISGQEFHRMLSASADYFMAYIERPMGGTLRIEDVVRRVA